MDVADGEAAKEGLSEDGKMVGRRGASDVNVLELISFVPAPDEWNRHTSAQMP